MRLCNVSSLHLSIPRCCAVVFSLGVVLTTSNLYADGGGTVVNVIEECAIPGSDADGNILLGGTGQGVVVMYSDKIVLFCAGNNIINDSGVTQSFAGFDCVIDLPDTPADPSTTDTFAIVFPGGFAFMICTEHL